MSRKFAIYVFLLLSYLRGRRWCGLSHAGGAYLLLFALIAFIIFTVVPSMSFFGSSPVPPSQIPSSPAFIFGALVLLVITGYVVLKRGRR